MQALQFHLHLLAQLKVQGAQQLIQQKNPRVVDQRSCDGHALLLSAGKGVRLPLFIAGHLHQRQHLGDPPLDLILGHFVDHGAVGHIVVYRHMEEQGIALKDGIDNPLVSVIIYFIPIYDLYGV